ncbi:MAG: hypothetical protein ACE5E9_03945 [Nitrospinaceae bacterium]
MTQVAGGTGIPGPECFEVRFSRPGRLGCMGAAGHDIPGVFLLSVFGRTLFKKGTQGFMTRYR